MSKQNKKDNSAQIQTILGTVSAVLLLIIAFQLSTTNAKLMEVSAKLDNLRLSGSNAQGGTQEAKQEAPSQPARPTTAPSAAPTPSVDMEKLADDDPVKGDENAPVTIVEWSDFQCPFCGRFYSQTLSQIEDEYVKTGKVKIVYRDFPLSFHQHAQKAAEAAECADDQGKFWEFHDKIFENQRDLSEENLKKWAEELGLDTEKFNACLDSGEKADEVKADMQDGSAAGIRGTPGFIINGKLISGAQPYSVFKQAIEDALNS
ncbi:DsbA family protein [Candidatus Woesearchaeota archaeon]|nr:MAG: DsbA family protein [Candidatus Woesearchaeota archaeon]